MNPRKYIPSKDLTPDALIKRRAGDAKRKRRQLALQRSETIEETHQRRQVRAKEEGDFPEPRETNEDPS